VKNHLTAVVENFQTDSDAKFIRVKQRSHTLSSYVFIDHQTACEVWLLLSLSESLNEIAEKELLL